MIYAECSIIDPETNRIKGKYEKSFEKSSDFNAWYAIVKTDGDTIMNIMNYNPNMNPGKKLTNDFKLLRVNQRMVI